VALSLVLEHSLQDLLGPVVVTVSLGGSHLGGHGDSRSSSGVGSVLGELLRSVRILEVVATVLVLIVTALGEK